MVLEWGPEEVGMWLEWMGLNEYRETFMANDVQGRELISLGRQDLKVRMMSVVKKFFCII